MANLRNSFLPKYVSQPCFSETDTGNKVKTFEFTYHNPILGGYTSIEVTYEKLADFIDKHGLNYEIHDGEKNGEHESKEVKVPTPIFISNLGRSEMYNLINLMLAENSK